MLDKGLDIKHWTPEQIAEHCKAIGADKPPPDKGSQLKYEVTAPQKLSNGKYVRRGGEY